VDSVHHNATVDLKLGMVSVVQFPASDEVVWLWHSTSVSTTGLWWMAWVVGIFCLLLHVQTTVALNCRLVCGRYLVWILARLSPILTERFIVVFRVASRWMPY
jgi:hypothetical protein